MYRERRSKIKVQRKRDMAGKEGPDKSREEKDIQVWKIQETQERIIAKGRKGNERRTK